MLRQEDEANEQWALKYAEEGRDESVKRIFKMIANSSAETRADIDKLWPPCENEPVHTKTMTIK